MRFCKLLLTIVIFSTYKTIDGVECTILRDTARTLPSDFWPSNWPEAIRKFLSNGGLWELPRNTAIGILRLVSPLNAETGPMMITFKPEDGPRASYAYQQRFGFRGHRLIELLGTGFGSHRRVIEQPVLEFSLTPPLPPLPSSW
ncbi:hypothetical protein KPH14_004266 [Odynerus spinipes]|uniref:Secreted protein n=1 Tax=Odynerus spinipes TaxID=1348599 RepID=A0AAD9RYH1_9HYME|nr:hypothetical protein KPH14_004266 [Odynerus spinipes]